MGDRHLGRSHRPERGEEHRRRPRERGLLRRDRPRGLRVRPTGRGRSPRRRGPGWWSTRPGRASSPSATSRCGRRGTTGCSPSTPTSGWATRCARRSRRWTATVSTTPATASPGWPTTWDAGSAAPTGTRTGRCASSTAPGRPGRATWCTSRCGWTGRWAGSTGSSSTTPTPTCPITCARSTRTRRCGPSRPTPQGGARTSLDMIAGATWAFLRNYLLKRGFVLGSAGFVISVLNTHYTFVKLAKLRELRAARPHMSLSVAAPGQRRDVARRAEPGLPHRQGHGRPRPPGDRGLPCGRAPRVPGPGRGPRRPADPLPRRPVAAGHPLARADAAARPPRGSPAPRPSRGLRRARRRPPRRRSSPGRRATGRLPAPRVPSPDGSTRRAIG